MSTAWPADIIAQTVLFRMQKNTSRNASPLTKTVQEIQRQGRRFIATFTFRGVGRAAGQRIYALLDKGDSFLMWDQAHERPLNGLITGVLVNGAHVRGNTTIAIDGLPISQTHLKAGDYLGIGGKLYRLVSDVAANGSGQGTALLNRGLLADAADNAAIELDKPTCEMYLIDDDQAAAALDNAYVYDFSLSFQEAISTS